MAAKKKSEPKIDPTLPFTEIEIRGTVYKMCFDLEALFAAEDELVRLGHDVNLLCVIPRLNATNTRILFAMSLRVYHPDLPFEEARRLVTLQNVYAIALLITEVLKAAFPDPVEEGSADPQ